MIGLGINLWRAALGGGGEIDTAVTGTLLVDFTVQPITATAVTYGASGQTVTNDGAFGNYTATANVIAHDSALTGALTTKIADGWQLTNNASTAPGSAKDFRPAVAFSPDLDFSNVSSLTFEWGFPVAPDYCQGAGVGFRPRLMDGAAFFWPTAMITQQAVQKSERILTRVNCGALGASGWTLQGGTPLWGAISEIQARVDVAYTNGGTKVVLRRIWANLKQGKAKIAFNFDDLLADHYANVRPLMAAAGAKVGLAASTTSLDPVELGGVFMTSAQLVELHNTYGWSIYPHMRSHDPALAVGLTFYSYDTGTNRATFSVPTANCINDLDDAITAGGGLGVFAVTIRGGWGPEYTEPSRVVTAIDVPNLRFTVQLGAVDPHLQAAASLPGMRMDWPNISRENLMVAELDTNIDYLETTLGTNFRGRNIFTVPRGDYDPSYIPDLEGRGFVGARSTNSYVTATAQLQTAGAVAPIYKTSTTTVSGTICMPGWFDEWDIRVIPLDGLAYSRVAEVYAMVDDAVAHGQFICFMGHYVTSGTTPGGSTVSLEVLTDLVNYCKTKVDAGTAQWVTLEEIVDTFA